MRSLTRREGEGVRGWACGPGVCVQKQVCSLARVFFPSLRSFRLKPFIRKQHALSAPHHTPTTTTMGYVKVIKSSPYYSRYQVRGWKEGGAAGARAESEGEERGNGNRRRRAMVVPRLDAPPSPCPRPARIARAQAVLQLSGYRLTAFGA